MLIKSSLRESRILGHRVVPINAGQEGKDGLAAALEIVRTDLGAADVDCAACVPAAMFSCRNLQVPFGNPQKIRMILSVWVIVLLA